MLSHGVFSPLGISSKSQSPSHNFSEFFLEMLQRCLLDIFQDSFWWFSLDFSQISAQITSGVFPEELYRNSSGFSRISLVFREKSSRVCIRISAEFSFNVSHEDYSMAFREICEFSRKYFFLGLLAVIVLGFLMYVFQKCLIEFQSKFLPESILGFL